MINVSNDIASPAAKEQWRVVVVCEDEFNHDRAIALSHELVSRFWSEFEFEFQWWQFNNLFDSARAMEAAEAAAQADMIVVAANAGGDFPDSIKGWCKAWLKLRNSREGAVVGLIGTPDKPARPSETKMHYLHDLAHRAEMDFLSELGSVLSHKVPESFEWFHRRAGQVSSTLDSILHLPQKPPSFGLDS